MKCLFLITAAFLSGLALLGQTNEPAKLAIVAESPNASAVCDILTAQLTSDNGVRLLERDAIDKVYNEQEISAANRDDVKLGRLLGADGLLLLDVKVLINSNGPFGPQPCDTNIIARLIAVKPGVIVMAAKYSVGDPIAWSSGFVRILDSNIPKLTVSAMSAIPVSIVNLRSSIQTPGEETTEQEIKQLAIERLSREPQLFVLEREQMQQLSGEKAMNSDESAFWDGSYLLDGTIDQNGYSPDILTIDARLTPPKGGAPLSFEVSGSRTNLADVVNQLAAKVTSLLNLNAAAPAWNAADEARQYFDEAKWALRWKSFPEAEESVDSAWALGKQDVDCAEIRVMSYIDTVPEVVPPNIKLGIPYVHINNQPDIADCDAALKALEHYYEFCRASTNGLPEMVYHGPDDILKKPDWYFLGVDTLVAASEVLQHYYFNPASQPAAADKLSDLRSMARSVADVIAQSPSVHDSYFVGDRIISSDQLIRTFSPAWESGLSPEKQPKRIPNLFDCILRWGPYWQERPEDEITLYRELMSAPLFFCIHDGLWSRKPYCPRLVAWNQEDKQRLPMVWSGFINELDSSTNYFFRFEGKALACAEARDRAWAGKDPNIAGNSQLAADDAGWKASREALLDFIATNYASIVGNNGNLYYNGWGTGYLFGDKIEYTSRFAAIQREYVSNNGEHLKEIENRAIFNKQIKYLTDFTPFDWNAFNNLFSSKDYSRNQAAQLLPLIATYKSNLLAKAATGNEKFMAGNNAHWIDFYLGNSIRKALNPPAHPIPSPTSSPAKIIARTPGTSMPPVASGALNAMIVSKSPPEIPTNILTVTRFLPIPYNQLSNNGTGIQIFAERWSEGKLLAGLEYHQYRSGFDLNRNWTTTNITLSAVAILNPTNQKWDFIECPMSPDADMVLRVLEGDTERLILFQGNLYTCVDGPLQEFNFRTQSWRTLETPGTDKSFLFALNDHLYAANDNAIIEIANGGRARILASTRRRPAITALDSLENFHAVQMFAGPDQSVCASIGQKIYRWDGNDWHEILTANASEPPEIFEEAVVFRHEPSFGSDDPGQIWLWHKDSSPPELCLLDKRRRHPDISNPSSPRPRAQNLHPLWRSLDDESLAIAPATFYQSNLYFFVEHSTVTNIAGRPTVLERDGYHAKLVCLTPGLAEPIVIPVRFDANQGKPASNMSGMPATPWLARDTMFLDTTAHFSDDQLFFSQRNVAGVWSIPISELQSAIAAQKQVQLGQMVRAGAAAELNDETAGQNHQ